MDKDYVQLNLRENNEEFLINLSPDETHLKYKTVSCDRL